MLVRFLIAKSNCKTIKAIAELWLGKQALLVNFFFNKHTIFVVY